MSTQRQNSLSNIRPPQFPSCPQLIALPPTLRKKDNLYPQCKTCFWHRFYSQQHSLLFSYIFATVDVFTKYYISMLICLQIVSSSPGGFWKPFCWIKFVSSFSKMPLLKVSCSMSFRPACACMLYKRNDKRNSKPFRLQHALTYIFH